MPRTPIKRRWLWIVVVAGALICAIGLMARLALTEMAVGALLKLAGASEVKFNVARASPRTVVLEDIGFQMRTQLFAAKRISMERLHWWTPSLGTVRVEQATVPYAIDGSDAESQRLAVYHNSSSPSVPSNLPVDELHVDGQLVIRAADVPEQALSLTLDAFRIKINRWEGSVELHGPGIGLKTMIDYDLSGDRLSFDQLAFSLDLAPWQAFVQRLVVMPGGGTWETQGKFSGNAEGQLVGKVLKASGTVQLREGRVRYEAKNLTAEGIEADLAFTDFDQLLTKPGAFRVQEIRVGNFPLREISAEIALAGREKIAVSSLSLKTLGGKASAEPFSYFPNLHELDVVVAVEDISVEEVMGLTKDLPAKATGRVNGRFPVRIDESGVRLGTGWLELKRGVYAELQLQANGLLTGSTSEKSPSYAVLKKVESGLLKLKIDELRLDIRPPNAPAGRSAQLRIAGSPVDPTVKAPVTLDLNVNGPLEKLINLGLDSRLKFK